MIVYVSNAGSRDISVLRLNDRDGSVRLIETVTVAGKVMPLAIDPRRKFLFASQRSEPYSVGSWTIDPDNGTLSSMQTVPAADNLAYLSIDRTGRYLFGASYFGDKISINTIGARGEVSSKPLMVASTGKHPHCIVADPSNKFVFVPTLGADAVLQYRFDERSGSITPNSPPAVATKKGAGPRHLVFHPDGIRLFCTNELGGTVGMYRMNGFGTLTQLGSISLIPAGFKGKPWAADIHLTLDGRFLYASERSSNTIAAFRIHDDMPTLIGHYPTETQPRGFNLDPQGRSLLAAGELSNGLAVFKIDGHSGALRRLMRVNIGKGPNWVEIIALRK